jgi:hypothetical protein
MPVTGGSAFRCVLACWVFFLTAPVTFAQQLLPSTHISIEARSRALGEVLDEISKNLGISFSYNPRKIPLSAEISYSANDELLDKVLREVLGPLNVSFSFVESQIVLKPEKKNKSGEAETFTLSGYVKEKSNGEALIGTTILVTELGAGAVTNAFGFYSLTIPRGNYGVNYSFIGFKPQKKFISLSSSQKENIELVEEAPLLDEIVVTGNPSSRVEEVWMSQVQLKPETVEQRPSFFGETDVIKSLEAVPGIKMHSDGSTFYSVRGGNRDQNLIFIDNAPVFNPSHLLGLFSTVIPDAVNDATLYKGDMPASLGGRLSSILDIETRKGNNQHFQAWGSVGLISTKVGIEGPIKRDNSSYLLTGRFSRLAWLFANNENVTEFGFYDLTGKASFKINDNNRIYFSFYNGRDGYFNRQTGIEWSNRATTLRWNHLFNDRLFLNTTFSAGEYDYFLHQNLATHTSWNSQISNFNLKADFSYFIKPENELTFGLSANGYNFNPGNLYTTTQFVAPVVSVRNSKEFVLYGHHELKLSALWKLSYGLRLTNWISAGEAFEYVFDETRNPVDTLFFGKNEDYNEYNTIEPRLSLVRKLNETSSVKLSATRNVQNIHLINNSVSPFSSLEVWLPSSLNIKPQTSRQIALGYYKDIMKHGISLEAEMYYKRMNNQIDYEAHAETLLNPYVERELRFGTARAYGVELLARKEKGRLHGWMGYTFSRVKQSFAEINDGKTYNAFYDRPHQLNLMLGYDVNLRWKVGANWTFTTGAPYSSPVGFYNYNDQEIPIYGEKNNSRLPDYHRLDLSGTYKLNRNPESKFQHDIVFSIYNFYGRKNILFVDYNKTPNGESQFVIPSNLLENERLTTQRFFLRFAPAVTYNFKWR